MLVICLWYTLHIVCNIWQLYLANEFVTLYTNHMQCSCLSITVHKNVCEYLNIHNVSLWFSSYRIFLYFSSGTMFIKQLLKSLFYITIMRTHLLKNNTTVMHDLQRFSHVITGWRYDKLHFFFLLKRHCKWEANEITCIYINDKLLSI